MLYSRLKSPERSLVVHNGHSPRIKKYLRGKRRELWHIRKVSVWPRQSVRAKSCMNSKAYLNVAAIHAILWQIVFEPPPTAFDRRCVPGIMAALLDLRGVIHFYVNTCVYMHVAAPSAFSKLVHGVVVNWDFALVAQAGSQTNAWLLVLTETVSDRACSRRENRFNISLVQYLFIYFLLNGHIFRNEVFR